MRRRLVGHFLAPWLGVSLLLLAAGPARALVSIEPGLARTLRDRGVYDAVMARLDDAQRRGFFEAADPAGAPPDAAGKANSWHVLFLLVDFDDRPASGNYGIAEWESLLTSSGTHPTGSLRDFYAENSYGAVEVTGDVVGWYRMPEDSSYYCNYDGVPDTGDDFGFGSYPHNVRRLLEDAIATADDDVDFNDYLNGFAGVRGVFLIHSGHGAETTGDPDDIWSHFSSYVVPTADGVDVVSYTTEPELQSFSQATVGVFVHEFGHVLNLPDLYDIDGSSAGVGRWSVMGSGSWNGGGTKPAHFDAWSKRFLGYVSTTLLSEDTPGLAIDPVNTVPVVYRIQDDAHASTEYLLMEYRKRTGFDANLPASGLLVWHVDTSANTNASETCGPALLHPKVRLIQADGLCQLEAGVGAGDAGDPFPGSTSNTRFGSVTTPNSRAYSGDKTGILLDDITLAGYKVTLDVVLDEVVQVQLPSAEFTDLQDALDLLGNGDEVRLQEDFTALGHFVVGQGIKISGGWDATFTTQGSQATSAIQGVGVLLPLLTVTATDTPAVLEKLELRGGGGRKVFQPAEAWRGGGVYLTGSLEVHECRFENNAAGPNDPLPSSGGAIYSSGGTVTIDHSAFAGNFAKEGGDIHVTGGSLTLLDTGFEGGTLFIPGGVQRGGAVLADGTTVWVENTAATGYTTADEGGFLYASGAVTATVLDSQVDGCAADSRGGGFFLQVDGVVADGVTLTGNAAGSAGGGAYLQSPSVSWTGGLFEGNSSGATGGGLQVDDALAGSRIASTVFSQNSAPYVGAGLVLDHSTALVEHLVFHGNTASVAGSALQVVEGLVSARNNVFEANGAGAVLWSGTVGQLDYNLYWNNTGGDPVYGTQAGPNARYVDPVFVDASNGDFHLGPGSEAIDAGDGAGPPDFDGSGPDLGVHGGADDAGGRPGPLEVVGTPSVNDVQFTWVDTGLGTVPVEVWIFGLEATGLPKRMPGDLLAVIAAPDSSWTDEDALVGRLYAFQAVDAQGRAGAYVMVQPRPPVAVESVPARFHVGLPTPNPFNPRTEIAFELGRTQEVRADVFDVAGRRVRRLLRGPLIAGSHRVQWNGTDDAGRTVASGSYVFRLRGEEGVVTRRLLLIK